MNDYEIIFAVRKYDEDLADALHVVLAKYRLQLASQTPTVMGEPYGNPLQRLWMKCSQCDHVVTVEVSKELELEKITCGICKIGTLQAMIPELPSPWR